ncbi:hypothetical protein BDV25DRAFT_128662 [Aspergillus avenaceus]|uniref:Heme oxygenase-like protein n=1 Tax=Aspergillus avenaceus TaxID=36643 RepID=A0A5N6TZ10_ASPAV|nr:hypothetical protein BDV25DRAFT_128662 [Aspergillus avenaceus]
MADVDLPTTIRAVIKEPHGTVNRMNTARIPLCLPPRATSPTLYTMGFSRYVQMYLGLEEAWNAQIGDPYEETEGASHNDSSLMADEQRVRTLLRQIYMPELLRTRRIEADLRQLTALSDTPLMSDANTGTEFRQYINERGTQKPHLLLAYVWVLYSAMFNGGRWIRGLLFRAGPEFWGLSSKELSADYFPAPLSFWQVDDYEKVKGEFRSRVVNADSLLTATERQEVLDETLEIFRRCEQITLELDRDAISLLS